MGGKYNSTAWNKKSAGGYKRSTGGYLELTGGYKKSTGGYNDLTTAKSISKTTPSRLRCITAINEWVYARIIIRLR